MAHCHECLLLALRLKALFLPITFYILASKQCHLKKLNLLTSSPIYRWIPSKGFIENKSGFLDGKLSRRQRLQHERVIQTMLGYA